jgi:hypothetical protein
MFLIVRCEIALTHIPRDSDLVQNVSGFEFLVSCYLFQIAEIPKSNLKLETNRSEHQQVRSRDVLRCCRWHGMRRWMGQDKRTELMQAVQL